MAGFVDYHLDALLTEALEKELSIWWWHLLDFEAVATTRIGLR
jgi:hypothetical protein